MGTRDYINFGKWTYYEWYLNHLYQNLAWRLRDFIHDIGPDKYNRTFNVEPLIEFAINNTCAHKPVDYIYKAFVEERLFSNAEDEYDFCFLPEK